MGTLHRSYAVSGGVATAGAATIPGTVAYDLLPAEARQHELMRIGHPGGIIEVGAVIEGDGDRCAYQEAVIGRTARLEFRLMAKPEATEVAVEKLDDAFRAAGVRDPEEESAEEAMAEAEADTTAALEDLADAGSDSVADPYAELPAQDEVAADDPLADLARRKSLAVWFDYDGPVETLPARLDTSFASLWPMQQALGRVVGG